MSSITQRSLIVGALAAIAAFGGASAAEAGLPIHPCTPELQRLLQEWNDAGLPDVEGFQMPSKPGQAMIHGRNGRVITAAAVGYMASQIRQALIDCQHGDVAAVRQQVALVSERLHQLS